MRGNTNKVQGRSKVEGSCTQTTTRSPCKLITQNSSN